MSTLDVDIPGLKQQFIAGTWQGGANSNLVDVISPSTEEVLTVVAAPTIEDANLAVAEARTAFDAGPWPLMSIQERIQTCTRLCDALETRLTQMNRAWAFESGATVAHGEMINSGAGVAV